jgi:tRNA U54 and U55 pseudouridine synthase Pus10
VELILETDHATRKELLIEIERQQEIRKRELEEETGRFNASFTELKRDFMAIEHEIFVDIEYLKERLDEIAQFGEARELRRTLTIFSKECEGHFKRFAVVDDKSQTRVDESLQLKREQLRSNAREKIDALAKSRARADRPGREK